jgi:hypothetical protein
LRSEGVLLDGSIYAFLIDLLLFLFVFSLLDPLLYLLAFDGLTLYHLGLVLNQFSFLLYLLLLSSLPLDLFHCFLFYLLSLLDLLRSFSKII